MLKGKLVGGLKDKAVSLEGAAGEQIDQLLDQLKNALPDMQSIGLTIKDLRVGMGVVPEIEAKLTGSVDALDEGKIQKMIESKGDNKIMVVVLKGLQAAAQMSAQLADLGFKGVQADLKLGIPPKISISFLGTCQRQWDTLRD